jgi:hypothetical protein
MSSPAKAVYNPKAVIPHAALLGQACAHCRKFLAAASRRSLGRVSVPVWLVILSDQRPVRGLVGRYPANNLMGRTPGLQRRKAFLARGYAGLAMVSHRCPPLEGRSVRVPQPCAAVVRRPPRDLHALGTPPAFVLSQDQTLHRVLDPGAACATWVPPHSLARHHDSVVKVQGGRRGTKNQGEERSRLATSARRDTARVADCRASRPVVGSTSRE